MKNENFLSVIEFTLENAQTALREMRRADALYEYSTEEEQDALEQTYIANVEKFVAALRQVKTLVNQDVLYPFGNIELL